MRFSKLRVGLVAVACALAPGTSTAAAAPTTCAAPMRVVSLSPTATEMLYAIGAGPQVIAVDDQSDYPKRAPDTKLSGFKPNAEAILKYRPDLVVMQNDSNRVAAALRAARVTVILGPAATKLNDSYAQIRELGVATCRRAGAARTVAKMKAGIARALKSVPTDVRGKSFYHELDDTYYSTTSKTFIGQIYGLLGLKNIADAADAAGDYPQLSAEYIISSDPDFIFLADATCCGQNATTIAARPGWGTLSAVKNDAVIPVNEDIASRWGPRVVTFLRIVSKRLATR